VFNVEPECSVLNKRGRVEACETIIDLIENYKDNYVRELNRTNDEIMSNREINMDP
jgi:hypothetical protein